MFPVQVAVYERLCKCRYYLMDAAPNLLIQHLLAVGRQFSSQDSSSVTFFSWRIPADTQNSTMSLP